MPYHMVTTMLICVLYLLVITSRCLAAIPIGHNRQRKCGKPLLQIIYRNARWSSQIQTQHATSQDNQTRQLLLRRAIYLDISVLATTSTLTLKTHTQLKGSSCSSAIPSSTQGMPFRAQLKECHSELNSRNATCLTPISSSTQGIRFKLNSRNTSNLTFKA